MRLSSSWFKNKEKKNEFYISIVNGRKVFFNIPFQNQVSTWLRKKKK